MNETVGGVTPYPPYGNATRVGEGVVIRGRHRIMVGNSETGGASLARSEMDSAFAEPLVFVGSSSTTNPVKFRDPIYAGIPVCLPPNVMLITYARLHFKQDYSLLLRLGHQYGIKDSSNDLSLPVTIDLGALFPNLVITSIVEKTIGGAEEWSVYQRRKMNWINPLRKPSDSSSNENIIDFKITLSPMQIRTFEVTLTAPQS
jgi:Glycosyl hydrolases family 38 C-terminal beta sandwich domain